MTVTASLSRGDTSVGFKVIDEAGEPLIARDFGKPQHGANGVGDPNPLPEFDARSGNETIRINTVIESYQQVIRLCNLIKAHSGGRATTLDIPLPEFDSPMDVFPAAGQDEALTVTYEPGRRDWVTVSLSLTRVNSVEATDSDFRADTPTASGDGPLTLSDSGEGVDLSPGTTVERALGRPNSDVRSRYTTYPKVIDERQSSYDAFTITLDRTDEAISKVDTLLSLFREQRGRDTLTLDFNGLYGMGAFNVIPDGSAALRHVRQSGRDGDDQSIPQIQLRVVQDP